MHQEKKKTDVVLLISNVTFKDTTINSYKEIQFLMIKRIIHQANKKCFLCKNKTDKYKIKQITIVKIYIFYQYLQA